MSLFYSVYCTDTLYCRRGDGRLQKGRIRLEFTLKFQAQNPPMFSMIWSHGFNLERHRANSGLQVLNIYLSCYYYCIAYNAAIIPEIEWCDTIIDFLTSFPLFFLFKNQKLLNDWVISLFCFSHFETEKGRLTFKASNLGFQECRV